MFQNIAKYYYLPIRRMLARRMCGPILKTRMEKVLLSKRVAL